MEKHYTYNEALYSLMSMLDTPIMRRKLSEDEKECLDIVKEQMTIDGTWGGSSNDNSVPGIIFKNRYGDRIRLVHIGDHHWRMFKEDNFFGISTYGDDSNYIALDFVSGGPMVAKGMNMNEFGDSINEVVDKLDLVDKINSLDIYTK